MWTDICWFFRACSEPAASPGIHLRELLGIWSPFPHLRDNPCWGCAILIKSPSSPALGVQPRPCSSSRLYPGAAQGISQGISAISASCCPCAECQPCSHCSSLAPLFSGAAFSFFSLWWSRHSSPATGTSFHPYYCFFFFLLITRRVPERSSALKWREILKNELVMRAINQSSLQPQQYEWVCWNERADEKWGTWIIWGSDVETFLYKVQRETLPSHGRGCPAGILIFSTQFLPAGSRGGFGGPGGVSVSVGAGRCAHLALLTWSLQQGSSCCSSQQPQTCTVCTLELQI